MVAGLSRGVGTSTVASALHAREVGLGAAAADILVCGSDAGSLQVAEAAAAAGAGIRPMLAIAGGVVGVPRARMRALEARFGTVVVLPYVSRWSGLAGPPDEVAALLGQPLDHLPRPLRSYSTALRALTSAVLQSGQLQHSTPPPVHAPVPAETAAGVRPPAVETRTIAPRRLGPRRVEPACGAPPTTRRVEVRPLLVAAPHPVRPTVIAGPTPQHRGAACAAGGKLTGSPRSVRGTEPDDPELDDPELDDLELDDEALEAASYAEPVGRAR